MSVHSDDILQSTAGSFWERGQYKRTVQRIEDANHLCDDMLQLINNRADIEKSYAKQLSSWSKKWNEKVHKGPEYGTALGGWGGFFTEAESVASLHEEIRNSLMAEVYPQIKQWQKENFHKSMGKIKEVKEMDDGFRKAQKPWKQRLEKVEKAQKDYYGACKAERTAQVEQNNARGDSTKSPDYVKKLNDRVEKCEKDKRATKDKYENFLAEINAYNAKYMEDMSEVYNKCQDFEEKRLKFFKDVMFLIHRCLDLSSNSSYTQTYNELHTTISTLDHVQDLRWWSQHHGVNMPMHWPEFEDWSPEMRSISTKRNTGQFDEQVTLKRRTIHETAVHAASFSASAQRQTEAEENSLPSNSTVTQEVVNEPAPVEVANVEIPTVESSPSLHHVEASPRERVDNGNPFDENEEDDDFFKDDGKPGVAVVAIYDYTGLEDDEITFKTGDRFEKLQDEDEQGWCKARYDGRIGLYPASYARELQPDEL